MSRDRVYTRAELREIDRLATAQFGIPSIELMETAARALADECARLLAGRSNPRVLAVCGRGNNGGDGLAAARLLRGRGISADIVLVGDGPFSPDAAANLDRARQSGVPVAGHFPPSPPDLVIDAIFGTGLTRAPGDDAAAAIAAINALRDAGAVVVAADCPSGLDADTGLAPGVAVRAHATVTFVGPKAGYQHPPARQWLGRVVVAGIGAPAELVARFGREPGAVACEESPRVGTPPGC